MNERLYRQADIDVSGADDTERSLPLVLATETPVPTYDFLRGEVVNEVLDMSGLEEVRQVPLVDSHERDSVRNVLGSIRDLRVENGNYIGRAYFASDEQSQRTYELYRDGHLTDFSIGCQRKAVHYEGSTKVVRQFRPLEGSAVVAGADPNAKVLEPALRAYVDPEGLRNEMMEKAIKDLLVKRGMPEDLDGQPAVEWFEAHLQDLAQRAENGEKHDTEELQRIATALKSNQRLCRRLVSLTTSSNA